MSTDARESGGLPARPAAQAPAPEDEDATLPTFHPSPANWGYRCGWCGHLTAEHEGCCSACGKCCESVRNDGAEIVCLRAELSAALHRSEALAAQIDEWASVSLKVRRALCGDIHNTDHIVEMAERIVRDRDAALARASAAERERDEAKALAERNERNWTHWHGWAMKNASACWAAEKERDAALRREGALRGKMAEFAARCAKDCWSYLEDDGFDLARDMLAFLGLPWPGNMQRAWEKHGPGTAPPAGAHPPGAADAPQEGKPMGRCQALGALADMLPIDEEATAKSDALMAEIYANRKSVPIRDRPTPPPAGDEVGE